MTTAVIPSLALAGSGFSPNIPAAPIATGGAITWSGNDPELNRLAWRHAWLTLVTFGLYRFWAKTEWRREIWRSIRIDGRALAYTGTVRELLLPVIAIGLGLVGVLAGLLIAKWLAVPRPRVTPSPWRFVITIPLVYLLGLSVWRARAYLLTRTQLGGVAGALGGNRFAYAGWHLATALAMPLTLGFALPWRQVALQRRLIEGMELGGHRFTFDCRATALLKRFAVAWLGAVGVYLAAVLSLAMTPVGLTIATAARHRNWPHFSVADIMTIATLAGAAIAAIVCLLAWYRIGVWRHFAAATRMEFAPLKRILHNTNEVA